MYKFFMLNYIIGVFARAQESDFPIIFCEDNFFRFRFYILNAITSFEVIQLLVDVFINKRGCSEDPSQTVFCQIAAIQTSDLEKFNGLKFEGIDNCFVIFRLFVILNYLQTSVEVELHPVDG